MAAIGIAEPPRRSASPAAWTARPLPRPTRLARPDEARHGCRVRPRRSVRRSALHTIAPGSASRARGSPGCSKPSRMTPARRPRWPRRNIRRRQPIRQKQARTATPRLCASRLKAIPGQARRQAGRTRSSLYSPAELDYDMGLGLPDSIAALPDSRLGVRRSRNVEPQISPLVRYRWISACRPRSCSCKSASPTS
jgi:hypothetical protein